METIQYYSKINPTVGELVVVQFTKRTDAFFDAKLLEYPYRGMMNYQDATKKRRVSSWNKIVPLNRNMVAKVDEVDETAKIVQLSIAYLGDVFTEELNPEQVQEKLLINFNENKVMESFIKSLCITHDYNYSDIWTGLVHYIDELRQDFNNENENNLSLWKYFCDNILDLDSWIQECNMDTNIGNNIKTLYEKRTEEGIRKIITRVGIISLGGINPTKKLLKDSLTKINYNYILKYDTTPYYIFESNTDDSTVEDHQKFINKLDFGIKNINPKIFIKVDYLAKMSNQESN